MGGLTLNDIDVWQPTDVEQVFSAANQRAQGARDTATRVVNLTMFESWDGDAAVAARDAAGQISIDLNTEANACGAIAKAAKAAAYDIETVKSRLRQIRGQLDNGITIDNATATVLPPGDLLSRPNAAQIKAKVEMLQQALYEVMADAAHADDELATAIRAALGELSPGQVDDALADDPTAQLHPPTTNDPAAARKWWDSLSPHQQIEAISAYGEEIGNLDGIPGQVRSVANISRLDEEIAKQQAILKDIPLQPNGIPDATNLTRAQNAMGKLNDFVAIRDTLAKHPEAGLMLLDTESNAGRVLAATFVGDVDNAKNVSVTTPGMNTRVSSSIDGMTGEAINLRNQALALAHGDSVASIAWIGYETPSLGTVTDEYLANVGATQLNHFYQGLAATTNVSDQHLTALGHSYGSLTTSLALQAGSPVDDVVLYGSPGGEIPSASLLGVAPGHAYFEVAQHDEVAIEIADYGRFGPQLQDLPGMTPLWTGDGWTSDPSAPLHTPRGSVRTLRVSTTRQQQHAPKQRLQHGRDRGQQPRRGDHRRSDPPDGAEYLPVVRRVQPEVSLLTFSARNALPP